MLTRTYWRFGLTVLAIAGCSPSPEPVADRASGPAGTQESADKNETTSPPSVSPTVEADDTALPEIEESPVVKSDGKTGKGNAQPANRDTKSFEQRPSSIDISDLNFESNAPTASEAVDSQPGTEPKILRNSEEVLERFKDGSLERRWHVRLYVNFDRTKNWNEQNPDSWTQHGLFEEFYPDGEQLLMRGNYREGEREGVWEFWHPNGELAKHGQYKDGQLMGVWDIHREDGTLLRQESYESHKRHGTWRYFDEDGQAIAKSEQYSNDLAEGIWTTWHTPQQKALEAHFEAGKLDGPRRTWHPNGQLASEENFRSGKLHGISTRWNSSGDQLSAVEFEDGLRKKSPNSG